MKGVVVDTSIVIEFLRTDKGTWLDLLEGVEAGKIKILVPMVVVSELWAGRSIENKVKVRQLTRLLEVAHIVSINIKEAKLSGEIKRRFGLSLADAVVAACAMSHKAYLSTLNTKDFKKVKGLKIHVA